MFSPIQSRETSLATLPLTHHVICTSTRVTRRLLLININMNIEFFADRLSARVILHFDARLKCLISESEPFDILSIQQTASMISYFARFVGIVCLSFDPLCITLAVLVAFFFIAMHYQSSAEIRHVIATIRCCARCLFHHCHPRRVVNDISLLVYTHGLHVCVCSR